MSEHSEQPFSPSDPAPGEHIAGHFAASDEIISGRLEDKDPHDPTYPGDFAARALGRDRQGNFDAALRDVLTAMATLEPGEDESATDRAVRAEQRPSTLLNAGVVLLRTAARWRLHGHDAVQAGLVRQFCMVDPGSDDAAAYAWIEERAGQALKEAYATICERHGGALTWPPHQHLINIYPRMGALAAVEGRPLRALRFGLGSLAMAGASESAGLARHTSGATQEQKREGHPKLKVAVRGAAVLGLAGLALPVLRSERRVNRARDRLILARFMGKDIF